MYNIYTYINTVNTEGKTLRVSGECRKTQCPSAVRYEIGGILLYGYICMWDWVPTNNLYIYKTDRTFSY